MGVINKEKKTEHTKERTEMLRCKMLEKAIGEESVYRAFVGENSFPGNERKLETERFWVSVAAYVNWAGERKNTC